jgi:glucose-1-phosphate thymidylyltransferase
MIAIVLAGGYAKRLWPLTMNQPKALLPIANRSMIDYTIDKLTALCPQIERIVVSTNLKFQPQFQKWLSQKRLCNVELQPDSSLSEEEKLGAVKALANIVARFKNKDILVVAGDNLFSDDIKGFLTFFSQKQASTIALYHARDTNEVKDGSSVAVDNHKRVIDFIEKPLQPKTTLVGACIYAFTRGISNRLEQYLELKLPRDEPGKFIEWLHKQESVYGYMLKGFLLDIGTLESYKAADKFLSLNLPLEDLSNSPNKLATFSHNEP